MKPVVIALCGPPGAGKSALARAMISLRPAYKAIDHDAFPNQTARSFADIKAWFERGGDPNEFPLPELEARLDTLSADQSFPALLFETPFGRTHRRTGQIHRLSGLDRCAARNRSGAPDPRLLPAAACPEPREGQGLQRMAGKLSALLHGDHRRHVPAAGHRRSRRRQPCARWIEKPRAIGRGRVGRGISAHERARMMNITEVVSPSFTTLPTAGIRCFG